MKVGERRLLRQDRSVPVLEQIDRLRAELARTALPTSGTR